MNEIKEIGLLLKSINIEAEKRKSIMFNKYDLTGTQSDIIMYLIKNGKDNIYQKDLEKFFNISNPAMTGILNRLESKGYIIRKKEEKDSRLKKINLTSKSFDLENELKKSISEFNAFFKEELTKEDIHILKVLLNKVYLNMIK